MITARASQNLMCIRVTGELVKMQILIQNWSGVGSGFLHSNKAWQVLLAWAHSLSRKTISPLVQPWVSNLECSNLETEESSSPVNAKAPCSGGSAFSPAAKLANILHPPYPPRTLCKWLMEAQGSHCRHNLSPCPQLSRHASNQFKFLLKAHLRNQCSIMSQQTIQFNVGISF